MLRHGRAIMHALCADEVMRQKESHVHRVVGAQVIIDVHGFYRLSTAIPIGQNRLCR